MRALLFLLLLLGVAACTDPHALTYTQSNAAIWNVNPGQWDGGSHP
jgi:hypothetical protein